ncbi:hypothetical protein DM02DRAFT_68156 [Periconia macrospinosa]|uniref:MYND-type domain-containing protein n=1 Tax=Periconia macrospinosa TaxID=97972 RepID=A0A2V1CXG3_9PLEO|nr:hypothetical protein DM02DRAFT_68156 [Periconia macrospinosa]
MATCPVRFDFRTELQGTLKYIHNIPRSFVTSNAQVTQHDPEYIKNFVAAIRHIMLEHEAACRAASNPKCQSCGSPTVQVLLTPMSWLHIVDEPFINVLVNPVCDKSDCEMRTRQQIQDMMAEVTAEVQEPEEYAGKLRDTVEVLPCKDCGVTKTKKCARCKVVAYCGKEHQKADWKVHKRACASLAR